MFSACDIVRSDSVDFGEVLKGLVFFIIEIDAHAIAGEMPAQFDGEGIEKALVGFIGNDGIGNFKQYLVPGGKIPFHAIFFH